MGWCRYDWVYGASSVASDPSRYQVLLVSLIPTYLSAKGIICNTIFSVSLRTWISSLRIHECLRLKTARIVFPGCVSSIFCLWLFLNSLPSPVNGYSEGRWPMANVGVYSYIIAMASLTSSELLLYSVVLWLYKKYILSTKMIISLAPVFLGASEEASPRHSCFKWSTVTLLKKFLFSFPNCWRVNSWDQRWYYVSKMETDECLLLKCFDSGSGVRSISPHSWVLMFDWTSLSLTFNNRLAGFHRSICTCWRSPTLEHRGPHHIIGWCSLYKYTTKYKVINECITIKILPTAASTLRNSMLLSEWLFSCASM